MSASVARNHRWWTGGSNWKPAGIAKLLFSPQGPFSQPFPTIAGDALNVNITFSVTNSTGNHWSLSCSIMGTYIYRCCYLYLPHHPFGEKKFFWEMMIFTATCPRMSATTTVKSVNTANTNRLTVHGELQWLPEPSLLCSAPSPSPSPAASAAASSFHLHSAAGLGWLHSCSSLPLTLHVAQLRSLASYTPPHPELGGGEREMGTLQCTPL